MRLNRKIWNKRIKTLFILLFALIFPLMLNTNIFKLNQEITNNTNQDNIEDDPTRESHLSIASSIPHADYFSYYKRITIDHTKV
ncbi:MAG: hypothetical protein ACFE9T_06030, partial [Promethearchaeota archaeon]